MGKICALCGKKPQTGCNVSHSKRHTKRQWKPNIVSVKTATGKVLLCAKCSKSLTKPKRMATKKVTKATS